MGRLRLAVSGWSAGCRFCSPPEVFVVKEFGSVEVCGVGLSDSYVFRADRRQTMRASALPATAVHAILSEGHHSNDYRAETFLLLTLKLKGSFPNAVPKLVAHKWLDLKRPL